MLYLSSSFECSNDVIPLSIQIVGWLFLGATLFFEKACSKFNALLPCTVLIILLVTISDTINNERFALTFLMDVMIFVSYLFVSRFSFKRLLESYNDVIAFLSIISLCGFLICIFVPQISSLCVVTVNGRIVSNFHLYVHNFYGMRNFGMFWEPGAFQCFLSVSILFEYYRNDPDKRRFFLYILTSVSTFSTTGYITIAFILLLILFRSPRYSEQKKIKNVVVVIVPIAIFLVFTFQDYLLKDKGTVLGKITSFVDEKEYTGGSSSSASVRYFAIIKPIEEFLDSPVFGCGYEHLQKKTESFTENMNTCTFVNYFAIYGFFVGVIFFIGYFLFCSNLEKKDITKFYLFTIFFLITMSENVVRIPFFIIIPLYGITGFKIHNPITYYMISKDVDNL